MTDASTDQTPARRGKRRERAAVIVTATELAVHLGLSRQRIAVLADVERVLERLPDGHFDQDACRMRYLHWLRAARRTARSTADAEHARAKTALLQIMIEEKQRILVRRDAHEAMIDQMAGLVLTKLGGWPARIAGTDLALRRRAEILVRELRVEIAEAGVKLADQHGEPPLDQQQG